MTKERKFKKEYARELFRIARNDLVAAKTLAKNKEVRFETVFFQLQQTVEKGLKALLVARELTVPLVHDLSVLIFKLGLNDTFSDELQGLSDFAAIRRYEEGVFVVSESEIRATFKLVERTLEELSMKIDKEFGSV